MEMEIIQFSFPAIEPRVHSASELKLLENFTSSSFMCEREICSTDATPLHRDISTFVSKCQSIDTTQLTERLILIQRPTPSTSIQTTKRIAK